MPERGRAYLDREGDYWKTLRHVKELCAMPHKRENPVLTIRNFCDHINSNIWPPDSPYYNLLDYHMFGWLVGWLVGFWHINLCRVLNTNPIFI